MSRRRFLVAYDIRDDRRLRAVAVCMEGYGTRVQYSVFVCDLNDREKFHLRADLEERMKLTEDSVMIVDLGACGDLSRFQFIGAREALPPPALAVVI
jgi:CRISPR-associated protein Cas2